MTEKTVAEIYQNILNELGGLMQTGRSRNEILTTVCETLHNQIPYFDWVGFYLVEKPDARELVLGPFVGEPTEHVRIPFGRGICGQAAEREETFIVQDVSKESNYLACSLKVKSEIVVPILKNGQVVGELDIDSHTLAPFSETDKVYLEAICEKLAALF